MPSDRKYLELRVSYRSILVVVAVVVTVTVVVALVTTWVAETRQAVVAGSRAHIGTGVWLNSCGPGEGDGAVYPSSDDVVAIQTVRNDARWEVEVVSKEPEAFRFGRLAEHRRDDVRLPEFEAGLPDAETSDRVVIPPGREVVMWIVDPLQEVTFSGGYSAISTVPVRVTSLGVSHETTIELHHPIWLGGGEFDKDRLEAAFEEVCDELNG